MMLSKNVNNKRCAPKLIFFNEKKIEKDSDNFWYRKLTLKVKRLGDFALFDTSPLTQFSKFNNFLWVCWFLGKNLSNFVPPVWNLHKPYCNSTQWEIFLYTSPSSSLTFFFKTCQKKVLADPTLWQYGLWSFQTGGTKLERFLPKKQHNQKKIFEFWELD